MEAGPAREATLLLGADHPAYGAVVQRVQRGGATACVLTAGADAASPALLFKGRADVPNEDALLAVDEGERTLLAVGDAHGGHTASHRLLQRLAAVAQPVPRDPLALLAAIRACGEAETRHGDRDDSRTTLLAAVWDRARGTGFGASFGDSTLLVLGAGGAPQPSNRHNERFVDPRVPASLDPRDAVEFAFRAGPGDVVLAFTDGIDGCHYRHPETSVQPAHAHALWQRSAGDVARFARALVELALAGVDGHPGGQDNIALIAACA